MRRRCEIDSRCAFLRVTIGTNDDNFQGPFVPRAIGIGNAKITRKGDTAAVLSPKPTQGPRYSDDIPTLCIYVMALLEELDITG